MNMIARQPWYTLQIDGEDGRGGYEIHYHSGLAKTAGRGTITIAPPAARTMALFYDNSRLPTALEQAHIYGILTDYPTVFNLETSGSLTDTSLRFPDGRGDIVKRDGDRLYWLREVIEKGRCVGRQFIPQTGFVKRWSFFGLPMETFPEGEYPGRNGAFFIFDCNKPQICVSYGANVEMINPPGILRVFASCSDEDFSRGDFGFRMVRGDIAVYR